MEDKELFESFLPKKAMTLYDWEKYCEAQDMKREMIKARKPDGMTEEDWILECEQGFNN